MRPVLLGCLLVLTLLLGVLQAQAAISVTVTYTADNLISAAYQNGGSPVPIALGTNAGDWTVADAKTLNLAYGTEYQLVFLAQNLGTASSSNPAGFLAEISGNVTGDLLTGVSWDYAVYDPNNPAPSDFDALTWSAATAYLPNKTPNWPWSRTVGGISTDSYWIWDGTNASGADEKLWIRGIVTTAAVPEPTTLLIWTVLGILGAVAYGRRK